MENITFAPLQTPICSEPVIGVQVHSLQPCSPRSMYSLATALGIRDIKEDTLKNIQSKLSTSNIMQELFSSFAASHKEVLDMEIRTLYETFIEKDPKLLTDHVRRMASNEAPFFSTTLSLIYDGMVERAFQKWASSFDVSGTFESQSLPNPTPPQAPTPALSNISVPTPILPSSSTLRVPAPVFVPASSSTSTCALLRCIQCRRYVRLGDLYDGLRCPQCPATGRDGTGKRGRPLMLCGSCGQMRTTRVGNCPKGKCGKGFL